MHSINFISAQRNELSQFDPIVNALKFERKL